MTFDAFLNQFLADVGSQLTSWIGSRAPSRVEELAAVGAGVIALWVGLIAATRLLAQVSSGGAFGLAVTWAALAFGTDALCHLYAVPPAGQGAAVFAMLGLMLFAGTRLLDTSWPRAGAVLVMGSFFGGLIALVLSLFLRLMNAI